MSLRSHNVTPPGGYRYTHPEPESHGFTSTGTTFRHLIGNAEQHRRNMGYPENTNLIADVELAICKSLDPIDREEYCDDATREWPLILQPMKLMAQPGDKGLGDIIARTVGPIGGDAYKNWFQRTFARGCGCKERQDQLNARYPITE